MELEGYEIIENEGGCDCTFFSEGTNGRIKKGVRFQLYSKLGSRVYNLCFGDVDEFTGKIDDLSVSNNHDLDKVLRTVAGAAARFFEIRPDVILFVRGSSLTRTRLYQMKIAKFLDTIRLQFDVYGFYKQGFIPFERGVNYSAFLIFKK